MENVEQKSERDRISIETCSNEIESKLEITKSSSQSDTLNESNSINDILVVENPSEPKRRRPNKTEKKLLRYQRKLASYRLKKAEKKRLKQLEREKNNASNNEQQQSNQPHELSNGSSNCQTDESSNNKNENSNEQQQPIVSNEANNNNNNNDGNEKVYETYINKRILKQQTADRLNKVYEDSSNNLKICIDCSFSNQMSDKEISRLAQQIGRCYSTNRTLTTPVHLTLCNLDKSSKFYKELCRVNDGFTKYIISQTDQQIESYYSNSLDSLAYLSPDSPTYLEDIDVNKTYVIGGLVDETVTRKVTLNKCAQLKLNTYSLPIEKYMTRKEISPTSLDSRTTYNYNKILAINQVFDILANYFITKDWPKSLECGVPRRKGFCVKESILDTNTNSNSELK